MVLNVGALAHCLVFFFATALSAAGCTQSEPNADREFPDVGSVQADLINPEMVDAVPAAGKRVKFTPAAYRETDVYHSLYLPTDWEPTGDYPVIVELAGNNSQRSKYGDQCSGRVEDCKLGYGISGGEGFIWVCLPYISDDGTHNQLNWWGDMEATSAYIQTEVKRICDDLGGDSERVLLAGFSRGAIGCNFVGLHDDEIAQLWCGFVCHSHYDGVYDWHYEGSDKDSALARLKRLGDRPQFISHENSLADTREYLADKEGDFEFQVIPFRNHTDVWVLRDVPARRALRAWVKQLMASKDG
jgi:hypothetical protein